MDDDDGIADAFTSDHLWTPSSFTDDPSSYESSLFVPLQLDGKPCRVLVRKSNRVQCRQSSSTIHTRLKNR